MSEEEDSYCRLCAETTPKSGLISPEEDVAVSSMIVTKMQWINIDISTDSALPSSICFSCFDQLERTYRFLNTVRTAQAKLQDIYHKNSTEDSKSDLLEEVGKPVNKDFEELQEVKPNVKDEEEELIEIAGNSTLLEIGYEDIKLERGSYSFDCDFHSSDGDNEPLLTVAKKKKTKKVKFDELDPTLPFPVITWESYTWRCGTCDALFQNVNLLRLHAIQIHNTCCVFKCNDCSKNHTSFRVFVKHVHEHKKLLKYCCEICNTRFNRSTKVKKHYNIHKQDFKLMCENCGLLCETSDDLHNHIILYSKGYKRKILKLETLDLKCNICNKKFKSRSNLQQHKLVHTERRREFSCHVCGKMFFTKGTLSTHMITHEDVKPYKCEHCSMSFRARGNLQSHISLHSGAKPFVCEQCGKSFRVKRLLKSHYIIHTDLMPYMCQYCNKTFRFKTRLNLHIRQHTGAKPYHCIYCQRDFTNGSNFKKHMKRRHNIDTSKKKFLNVEETDLITDDLIEQT